jgi:hypothetical protein
MILSLKHPWFAATVATLGMVVMTDLANAGSVQILPGNKTSYYGWLINPDAGLSVVLDASSDKVKLEVEKFGAFTNPEVVGLNISFDQTSATATSIIKIADEHILNNTGSAWSEFDILLIGVGGVTPKFTTTFDATDVAPFKTSTIVDDQTIALAGGILSSSSDSSGIVSWGAVSGVNNAVTIQTTPGATSDSYSHFLLKEVAVPVAVPLPAAAWSGFASLAGLALVNLRKKIGAFLS